MSLAGTEAKSLDVFLGRRGWMAYRGGSLAHSETGMSEADALKSLAAWGAQNTSGRWWAPSRVSLYLSGALCRPFLLPRLSDLSTAEVRLATDATAKQRTGLSGDLHVWLSPPLSGTSPDRGAHQLGAAVSSSLIQELALSFKRSRGFKLNLVQPLWSLALQIACAEDDKLDMLVVRDPDAVTMLASVGGGAPDADGHRRPGFATAVAVEAPLESGQQRHAVLRLLSGLEHEPAHARQFVHRPPDASALPAPETAVRSGESSAVQFPMSDSWALTPFDMGGV